MVTTEMVINALEAVNDPHVPVSLRRMGMLHEVTIDNATVNVNLTIPCLGCPAVTMLQAQIKDVLINLQGVGKVNVETSWGNNWQRKDIDPEIHPLLRQFGLQL